MRNHGPSIEPFRSGLLMLAAVVIAVCGMASVGLAATITGGTGPDPFAAPHVGRCFPAGKWAPAPDGIRPCVRVTRVYEDGSFKAAVSDASGVVRYSLGVGVPDAYECQSGAAPAACD
jgi:hypothetical protein